MPSNLLYVQGSVIRVILMYEVAAEAAYVLEARNVHLAFIGAFALYSDSTNVWALLNADRKTVPVTAQ